MKFRYLVEGSGGSWEGCYSFPVAVYDTEEAAQAWVDEYTRKIKEVQRLRDRLSDRASAFALRLEGEYQVYMGPGKENHWTKGHNEILDRYWRLALKTIPPQQECLQKILEDQNDVAEFHKFEVKIVMRKK